MGRAIRLGCRLSGRHHVRAALMAVVLGACLCLTALQAAAASVTTSTIAPGSAGGIVIQPYQSIPGTGCHSYPFAISLDHGSPQVYFGWSGLSVSVQRVGGGGLTVIQPNVADIGPTGMQAYGTGAFVHCAPPAGVGTYEITLHLSGVTYLDMPQPDVYAHAYTILRMRSTTSITLSATSVPQTATYRVTGQVRCLDPATFTYRPAQSAYVQLWFERSGTTTFVYQGYVWTTGQGLFASPPMQTGHSGNWQATWAGNATCFRSASSPRWIWVT